MPAADVFPKLQSCTRLGTHHRIFDVKFYPYATVDNDHVFAAVAETDIFICRPKLGANPPYDVLGYFRDNETYNDQPASYNSLVWTKDPTTGKPWLCIAGSSPKQIKIIDVETRKIVRLLSGHGRGVNDLAVSPNSTDILASCAEDGTIRLWNLTPAYELQPCVALLGGEGHKQPILAIHFHPNGRWLLSGGIDTAVALWAVPPLEELERDDPAKGDDPRIVYYPHFFSEEVHSNYADSLAFYGDLIISRAARDPRSRNKTNEILIWKIDGFDSDNPPPPEPAIPSIAQNTRSAFPHNPELKGFRRLATLFMPSTDRFYHRFGLYHKVGERPILAMGNQLSKYFFFDLQKLDEGIEVREDGKPRRGGRGGRRGGRNLVPGDSHKSFAEARRSMDTHSATPETTSTPAVLDRVSVLGDPFVMLQPDHTVTANTKLSERLHFATSQIAWSPDGTWMVGVGDYGMMCMFHRPEAAMEK